MKIGSSAVVANRSIVHAYLLTDRGEESFVGAPPSIYHRAWLDPGSATYFCLQGRQVLALLIREEDVRAILTPATATGLVGEVFRLQAEGEADNRSRVRIPYPHGLFHSMSAAVPAHRAVGMKAYAAGPAGAQFVVLLFDTESNTLLAIIEADWLGRIRTGAASAVATRYLAREDAQVLAVIGSGTQAETQIEAIAGVRPIEQVRIFSPTAEHRNALAQTMRSRLRARVSATDSAEKAVRESDVVVTITSAAQPVLDGAWLSPGCHVNAAGSNQARRREVDRATVERASLVVVDSLDQARIESGDLIAAAEEGVFDWTSAVELSAVVAGRAQRPARDAITLFESHGVAIEDIITARYVYDQAVLEGRGQRVPFGGTP